MSEDTYTYNGIWAIQEIIPGYIVRHAGIQAGEPTIPGTRMTTSSLWMWSFHDATEENIRDVVHPGISRDQLLVACAFEMGRNYEKQRVARKRFDAERDRCWAEQNKKYDTTP